LVKPCRDERDTERNKIRYEEQIHSRRNAVGNHLVVALGFRLIGRHGNRILGDYHFDDRFLFGRPSPRTRFGHSGRNVGINLNPPLDASGRFQAALGIVQFEIFFRRTLAHRDVFRCLNYSARGRAQSHNTQNKTRDSLSDEQNGTMGLVGGPVKTEETEFLAQISGPTAYTQGRTGKNRGWETKEKTRTYTVAVEAKGGYKEGEKKTFIVNWSPTNRLAT